MKSKHSKIFQLVYHKPIRASIPFANLEALVVAIGGSVRESEGSRVVFKINGKRLYPYRPHLGKEAKRYQVEELRDLRQLQVIVP